MSQIWIHNVEITGIGFCWFYVKHVLSSPVSTFRSEVRWASVVFFAATFKSNKQWHGTYVFFFFKVPNYAELTLPKFSHSKTSLACSYHPLCLYTRSSFQKTHRPKIQPLVMSQGLVLPRWSFTQYWRLSRSALWLHMSKYAFILPVSQ